MLFKIIILTIYIYFKLKIIRIDFNQNIYQNYKIEYYQLFFVKCDKQSNLKDKNL